MLVVCLIDGPVDHVELAAPDVVRPAELLHEGARRHLPVFPPDFADKPLHGFGEFGVRRVGEAEFLMRRPFLLDTAARVRVAHLAAVTPFFPAFRAP